MFTRKLQALDAPNIYTFNFEDDEHFRNLIVWLEDRKIKHYKIEDRAGLRSTEPIEFEEHLSKYLKDLECPYELNNRKLVVDWLLGLAVQLSYGDNTEKYRSCRAAKIFSADASSGAASSNPLEKLDLDDPAFKASVMSIAAMLDIPPHHDHKQLLKAIYLLIRERVPRDSNQSLQPTPSETVTDRINLEDIDLGFSTGDYVTDEAVKILRLLHIKNLRELQSTINEALVTVQKVTADPKTDQRLGKIGR